ELIEATPKHTPDSLAAIQLDTRSEAAAEVVPALLEQLEGGMPLPEPAATALTLLKNWNFQVIRDQPAPLIATAWLAELNGRVLRAKLGDLFEDYAQRTFITVASLIGSADRSWCADGKAPRPCAAVVRDAFIAAVDKLARAYGGDPSRWRWGDAH